MASTLMMNETQLHLQDLETFDKLIPPMDMFTTSQKMNWQEMIVNQASYNIMI